MKKIVCLLTLACVACLFGVASAKAQSVPPYINYQGMLTDSQGNALCDKEPCTKIIEFKIYNTPKPTASIVELMEKLIWGQRYESVNISKGQFNVILGAGNKIEGIEDDILKAFNGRDRYLEISIITKQENGSEEIVDTILPRQHILSNPYTLQAENAENAEKAVNAWNGVPIGTIVPFFGNIADLDGTGWVLCNSANSNAYPGVVPNLENRFIVGAGNLSLGEAGGRADIPTDGNHSHSGTSGYSNVGGATPAGFMKSGSNCRYHTHSFSTSQAGNHNHGGDNRPPFFVINYIIKIN